MIFRKFIVTVSVLFLFVVAVAHEGHDSATAKSLYGGDLTPKNWTIQNLTLC